MRQVFADIFYQCIQIPLRILIFLPAIPVLELLWEAWLEGRVNPELFLPGTCLL